MKTASLALRQSALAQFGLVAGLVVLIAVYLSLRGSRETPRNEPRADTETQAKLQARITSLETQVNALSRNQRLANVERSPSVVPRPPASNAAPQAEALQAPTPPVQDIEPAAYATQLEAAMREQSLGGAWATQAEGEITSAFASPGLAGSRLLDVQCRQTLCRLELQHLSEEGRSNFNQGILPHAVFQNTGFFNMALDEAGLRFAMFLARSGTELPAAAPE